METTCKTSNTYRSGIERLNEQYKKSCLDSTKAGINNMVNKFIDDESIDSDYKQKIINMMVTLLTLKEDAMKYYILTNMAEKQYRANSKRCNRMNFKREIIERRLNAMISISKDIFYFSNCDFEAGLFSCIITVKNN